MRHRQLTTLILPALAAALLASLAANALADSELSATLIGSARLWEQKKRVDLARAALEKLLAVEPDNPHALYLLGMMELRANRIDPARNALKQLQQKQPAHALTQALADALRVETVDRLRMAKARFFAKDAKFDEAAAALHEIFPQGAPTGDLGVEYWRIVGQSAGNWNEARDGLEKLAREEPENPLPGLALAELQTHRPDNRAAAVPSPAQQARTTAAHPASPTPSMQEIVALAGQRLGDSRYTEAAEFYEQASKQDVARRAQWAARAEDARRQAVLKEARAALQANDIGGAERRIQQVLAQEAGYADALALLARLKLAQQQPGAAEALYRHALAAAPEHAGAFNGLLDLLEAGKRPLETVALAETRPGQSAALGPRIARWLRDAADGELAGNHPSKAMALLERALRHAPAQAWVRHDLARLYARLGLPALGEAVMREGMLTAPASAEMRHAHALFLAGEDRFDEAIGALDGVPAAERTASMNGLRTRLQVQRLLHQAGPDKNRQALLAQAEVAAGTDAELLADVAAARFDFGERESALSRLRELAARQPSPDIALRLARLLARAGNPDLLERQLQTIAAMPGLVPQQREQLADLHITGLLQRVAMLAPDAAQAALQSGLSAYPDHQRLLAALAERKALRGETAAAADIYRQLIARDADNLDARIELAKILRKQGQLKTARRELDAAQVRAAPGDLDTRRALIRQYLVLEDAAMARKLAARLLETAPEDAETLLLAARAENAGHRREAAVQLLQRAEQAAIRTAPDSLSGIAHLWLDLGDSEHGVALLRARAERADAPPRTHLQYAEVLDRVHKDDTLAAQLARLSAQSGLTREDAADLQRLTVNLALRNAERRHAQGDAASARATLRTALSGAPQSVPLRVALAGLDAETGRYAEAEAQYREILAEQPDNLDTRVDLAKLLRLAGDEDRARQELEGVLAQAPADDSGNRLSVARQFLALGDSAAAREVIDPLLATHGDDPDVLVHAGRLEKADRHYAAAMQDFQQARQHETPADRNTLTRRTPAEREIATLNEKRRYTIEFGRDSERKPGDAGISHLATDEWPAILSLPLGYDSRLFVHADRVELDAGELNLADFATASDYGSIRARGLVANARIAQHATGVMPGIGIESDDWRADIGTTPLQFPVHSIVGGVRKSGRVEKLEYTLNLDRRAVTSSLVSYAGARDPASGAIWGGVTKAGATLRLARDLDPVSISAQIGAYHLSGRHVPDNNELAFRGVVAWTVFDTPHQRARIGLTLTHWKYDENLRYYTYGHGGYYSPQYYRALSLPLSWDFRYDRFSLELRASRSITRSREKAMPIYPLDPALQAGLPAFTSGGGIGHGYTLGLSTEYLLSKNLVVGARYQKDRSEFYTPNFLNLYLRYTFDGQEARETGVLPDDATVDSPPSAIKPYSAY